jgi:hypothetical protein
MGQYSIYCQKPAQTPTDGVGKPYIHTRVRNERVSGSDGGCLMIG